MLGHGVDVEGDVEGSLAQIFVSASDATAAASSHVAAEEAVAWKEERVMVGRVRDGEQFSSVGRLR